MRRPLLNRVMIGCQSIAFVTCAILIIQRWFQDFPDKKVHINDIASPVLTGRCYLAFVASSLTAFVATLIQAISADRNRNKTLVIGSLVVTAIMIISILLVKPREILLETLPDGRERVYDTRMDSYKIRERKAARGGTGN